MVRPDESHSETSARPGRGEGHDVRDLLPFGVHNPQDPTLLKLEGDASLRFEVVAGRSLHQPSPSSLEVRPSLCGSSAWSPWKGQRHFSCTGRPEYWRASERVPKSARFGLRLPWRLRSRSRMTSWKRSYRPSSRS